jgi:hypothetical protein
MIGGKCLIGAEGGGAGFGDLAGGQDRRDCRPDEGADETPMKNVTKAGVAVAAVATAQKLVRRVLAGDDGPHRSDARDRWHVVTVNLPPGQVSPDDGAPPPLRTMAGIEVRTQPAPGGRGTEIAARSTGADLGDLRRALREAKSLLETGDVLLPAGPPTTQPTPLNAPIRTVTEHAREEGRL